MKNKYLLLASFILFLLFANSSFALALEIVYPPVPGLPTITQNSTIGEYIGYFFGLAIMFAGIIAVISLAIGGIQLIMSAESPENATGARDRIKGAVLGLVLTLASFIILKTINPAFITPTLTPLPGVAGVFYTNGNDLKPAPIQESNTATIPAGFGKIFYKCDGPGPALLIWEYAKTGFGTTNGYQDARVERLECNNSSTVGYASFKMAFETPGIYYYLDDSCSGYSSGAIISSQDQIDDVFRGKIKSIRIINDAANNRYFGAIFHKEVGFNNGGACTYPIISSIYINSCFKNDMQNVPIANIPASSVEIFNWDNNPPASRDGVDFYSEAFGWSQAAQAKGEGYYRFLSSEIKNGLFKKTGDIKFLYTPSATPEYKNAFKSFKDSPGSINIKDHYLVGLYSQDILFGGVYCQTFQKDVPDLNLSSIIATGSISIDNVQIIPIK